MGTLALTKTGETKFEGDFQPVPNEDEIAFTIFVVDEFHISESDNN